MTGHGLALVLVGEALVGVAHVLRGVLQGEGLLPSGGLLLTAPLQKNKLATLADTN